MMAIQSINEKMPDLELRDLFAISVIQGMVTSNPNRTPEIAANTAYTFADAMIIARRKK